MPKLNKIRLTRIRYNNNLTGIDDALIDLDGLSTLLKLANGGGKTVLIQMLLAPYVSGRRRNFKGRPFSDYFKDPIPSFIVEEWIKDNRTGKFLIGLMVRKSQHAAEENDTVDDRKLDLYAFVAEYSEPCKYDIEHLQLIRQDPKAFLPFAAAREYLEELSRTDPNSFRLYNLSSHGAEKKFREKLTELNINRSEWDQLWEFNQDESGLSSLCEKYDTDQKLVRDVFVPAVEQKLDQLASDDRNFSQIDVFRSDLRGIAQMQLRNIENLENQKEMEQLLENLQGMLPSADQLIGHQESLIRQQEHFTAFLYGLRKESGRLEELVKDRERLIDEGNEELKRIEYEILSQRYYKQEAVLDQAKIAQEQTKRASGQVQKKIAETDQLIKRYELSDIMKKIEEAREQKAQYEGKIDSAKMSEQAVMKEAGSLGSALYQLISRRAETQEKEYESGQEELAAAEQRRADQIHANKERQKQYNEDLKKEGALNSILRAYELFEKQTADQLAMPIHHTLSMYEDEDVIRAIMDVKQEAHEQIEEQIDRYEASRQTKQQDLESCMSRMAKDNEEKVRLEHRLEQIRDQLADDEKVLEKRRFFIRQLGISGNTDENIWELSRIGEQFDYRIRLTQENIELASEMLMKKNRELDNMKTGTSLHLNEAIRSVLEELGILEMYGSEWLKNSAGGEAYRKRVLENHPFLPYALVMTDDEIARFMARMKEEKLFTSEPVPIISRNKLNRNPHPFDASEQGLYFYLSFNEALIDPESLKKMIAEKEGEIRSEQAYQSNQYEALEDLQKNKTIFMQARLDKKEYGAHLREKRETGEKMEKLLARISRTRQQEQDLKKEIIRIGSEMDRLSIQEKRAERQKELARQLFDRFIEASSADRDHTVLRKQMDDLAGQIEAAEKEIEQIAQTLEKKRSSLQDLGYRLQNTKQEADRFRIYEKETPASGEEAVLRGRFDALQKKLQASQIDFFEEQLARTVREIKVQNERFEKSRQSFEAEFRVEWDRSMEVSFSYEQYDQLQRDISTMRKQHDELTAELGAMNLSIGRIEGDMTSLIAQMQEKAGADQPLPKAQTRTVDLAPEKKRVNDLIRDAQKEQKAGEKRNAFCQMLEGKGKSVLKERPEIEDSMVPDLSRFDRDSLQERFDQEQHNLDTLDRHVKACQAKIEKQIDETAASLSSSRSDLLSMLGAMKETIDDGELFKKDLTVKVSICQSIADKLAGELERLKKNTELLNENLLDHVHKMCDQIKKIDRSTTITLNERRRQMLQIDLPDWETMKNVYKVQIEQWVSLILEEIVKEPNDLERIIGQKITAKELLGEVVGYQKIRLRLYKVEQGRESRISWSQANKTSGAEGFICAFVIVSALLAYRRSEDLVLSARKQGSVLLMDNPFAKVQSKHIVDALMNLCQATNTQFIAFSDVENSAIINAFDNIYTLRKKRRIDGRDTLEIEHAKGPEDEIEEIHVRIEQQSLF